MPKRAEDLKAWLFPFPVGSVSEGELRVEAMKQP